MSIDEKIVLAIGFYVISVMLSWFMGYQIGEGSVYERLYYDFKIWLSEEAEKALEEVKND